MTDTAKYADILLPAVTFLEQYEVKRAYGSYVVGGVQPVIPPQGEAKPNEEVFAMLGRAMGWPHEPFSWDTETYIQKIAETLTLGQQAADLSLWQAGKTQRYDFPGERPIQFDTVVPRTRMVRFTSHLPLSESRRFVTSLSPTNAFHSHSSAQVTTR